MYINKNYKVAASNEYLVKTGPFVEGIEISKTTFRLPFQIVSNISMQPTTINCVISEAMSLEKISFVMPTVFTIGPKDDIESLKKYSLFFHNLSHDEFLVKTNGIIKGEIRIEAGKMKLEDLFNNRERFKDTIVRKIDKELEQFGICIYNANIEELKDTAGNEYFVFLKKRALEGAVNKAKVDVAEQNKIGNIGEKQHSTETRQKLAEYETQAAVTENARNKEIAKSQNDLEIAKIEYKKQRVLADQEAKAMAEIKQCELQQKVEETRKLQEVEKLRAKDFSVANVHAEVSVREAQGIASAIVIKAEAEAQVAKRNAEGKADAEVVQADAEAKIAKRMAEGQAEALLLKAGAEAKAIQIKATAEKEAIRMIAEANYYKNETEAKTLQMKVEAVGGASAYQNVLLVEGDVLPKVAREHAGAMKEMKPTITYWNTDPNKSNINTVISDLVKSNVPLLENLKSVTGIDLLNNFKKST